MFDEQYEREKRQYLDARVPPLSLEDLDEGLLRHTLSSRFNIALGLHASARAGFRFVTVYLRKFPCLMLSFFLLFYRSKGKMKLLL